MEKKPWFKDLGSEIWDLLLAETRVDESRFFNWNILLPWNNGNGNRKDV